MSIGYFTEINNGCNLQTGLWAGDQQLIKYQVSTRGIFCKDVDVAWKLKRYLNIWAKVTMNESIKKRIILSNRKFEHWFFLKTF
jgi:hypothetical protein